MPGMLDLVIADEERRKIEEVRDLLEDIIETLNILLNKEALAKLREAEEDLKAKRLKDWEEVARNR